MRLRSTIDFLLYDWLQAEGLTSRSALPIIRAILSMR
jgi:hypothetical protein